MATRKNRRLNRRVYRSKVMNYYWKGLVNHALLNNFRALTIAGTSMATINYCHMDLQFMVVLMGKIFRRL